MNCREVNDISLAIVCPMGNESREAVSFVDAVLAQCAGFRAIRFLAVLDGASQDNTRELLEEHARQVPELTVVWAGESRGVVNAYVRGYREALNTTADWILEIDAGFSHRPADIPLLISKMREGYDCVFGSRFCPGGSIVESSAIRYSLSYGGTILANMVLGTKLYDMTSGFELFTREALQMVLDRGIKSRGPFFQTEIKTYCQHLKTVEVPIQYRAASHPVGWPALIDAYRNLWRLFRQRLRSEI